MAESEDTEGEQAKEGVSYDAPNGGYRAEIMTGSVPGSRRWMSTVAPLDLES
jgi:hypothetical protein